MGHLPITDIEFHIFLWLKCFYYIKVGTTVYKYHMFNLEVHHIYAMYAG